MHRSVRLRPDDAAAGVVAPATGTACASRRQSSDTVGAPLTFPNSFIFDDPAGADLFILDPPNELSTQSEDSSGSITFTELDCSTGGEVAFTIDAVVGSELGGQPTVSVTGSLSGGVGAAP